MDERNFILMHKEVVFQVTAKAHLMKCISMMKMNTFVQRPNLAAIKKEEEKEKGNQPSTSMAKQAAPSAPTAAAAPAAAGGPKQKRKRRKGIDTVTVGVQTAENDVFQLNHLEKMIKDFIINLRTIREEQFQEEDNQGMFHYFSVNNIDASLPVINLKSS